MSKILCDDLLCKRNINYHCTRKIIITENGECTSVYKRRSRRELSGTKIQCNVHYCKSNYRGTCGRDDVEFEDQKCQRREMI